MFGGINRRNVTLEALGRFGLSPILTSELPVVLCDSSN